VAAVHLGKDTGTGAGEIRLQHFGAVRVRLSTLRATPMGRPSQTVLMGHQRDEGGRDLVLSGYRRNLYAEPILAQHREAKCVRAHQRLASM
jgi:hypothetical protein